MKKTTILYFSRLIKYPLSIALCFMLQLNAYGQAGCCVGFEIGSGGPICLSMTPCTNGVTCTTAAMDAAHGITGIYPGGVTCNTGSPDCSGLCAPGNILPINLIAMYVDYVEKGIMLHWSTSYEENNEGFEIEHSTDGIQWKEIGFVAGNGTSFEVNEYSFLDESPGLGFNYYRFKQYDFNGTFDFSPVKVAIWQGGANEDNLKMAVLPNPSTTWITAALPGTITKSEDIKFEIYNQIGQLVKIKIIDRDSEIRIDTYDLPSGFYVLSATQENFQYSTSFIKT